MRIGENIGVEYPHMERHKELPEILMLWNCHMGLWIIMGLFLLLDQYSVMSN